MSRQPYEELHRRIRTDSFSLSCLAFSQVAANPFRAVAGRIVPRSRMMIPPLPGQPMGGTCSMTTQPQLLSVGSNASTHLPWRNSHISGGANSAPLGFPPDSFSLSRSISFTR